jgi:antitoxin ParD1/3/4
MNISLTSELERFVAKRVSSGLYHSASEVVRDGLRLLKEREDFQQLRLAELRKEIAVGIRQMDRGEYTVYDSKSLGKIVKRVQIEGRKRLAQRRKKTAS